MTPGSNKMISDFAEKPKTDVLFRMIADYATGLGHVKTDFKSQASFSVNRKFLWLWAYEQTADGTLYMNVTLDMEVENPNFHDVSQVSKNRWNQNVVVRSESEAESDWLRDIVRQGYEFASQ